MEMEQGESRYGVNVVAVGENRVRVFASSPSASCLAGWLGREEKRRGSCLDWSFATFAPRRNLARPRPSQQPILTFPRRPMHNTILPTPCRCRCRNLFLTCRLPITRFFVCSPAAYRLVSHLAGSRLHGSLQHLRVSPTILC